MINSKGNADFFDLGTDRIAPVEAPILNTPEVGILGVSRTVMRPVWKKSEDGGGSFEPRQILPLSLSYDHRVIDGAMAARFTTDLVTTLSDPVNLLV